jgi:hypothetical protein
MIAFEVKVNGKKVRTAGIRQFGDLCAHLNWRRGLQVAPATGFEHHDELLEFAVAGVHVRYKPRKAPGLKRGFKYTESLEWVTRKLRAGDEVTIFLRITRIDANGSGSPGESTRPTWPPCPLLKFIRAEGRLPNSGDHDTCSIEAILRGW